MEITDNKELLNIEFRIYDNNTVIVVVQVFF